MAGPLPADTERELADLARRYGEPLRVDAQIGRGFHDPIHKPDRIGEACLVIRRPNGRILLSIKRIYPRGAYRLPTGGIGHGEGVLDALLREAYEETGLDVAVLGFLARISYRLEGTREPVFHTFAFLLDEKGGTLGALDESEQIEAYREIDPADLPAVARALETIEAADGEVGSWREWGRFRAVVHRAVDEALRR